jgi:hypothetical protein
MKDIYLGELRRFRNAALIFAAVHLLLQLFINRLFDVPQQRWEWHMVMLAPYFLSGLGFALYQFGSYRQPSRWLWLLHRPLPRAAIFGAIALASVTLILAAVGLPALLVLGGADWLTERTVDARHYLMLLHLVLITIIAWLAGTIVVLNRNKSAIVILVLPALMLGHLASAGVMLVPALLCVALLGFVAYCSFRPDRAAPPASAAALVATALPLQLGFYFALLWSGSVVFQLSQMAADVHPLNRPVAPAGGFTESTRAEGADSFLAGLAASSDPRAPQWRRQLKLLKVVAIDPLGRQFPVRHQASNQDVLNWHDGNRHVEWTFSHDAMRFHGRDIYTGKDSGWIGLGGLGDPRPFPAVPVLPEQARIMTPHQLYAWDQDTQRVHQLIGLKAPEQLAGSPVRVGRHAYVLTNLRLIAYEPPAEGAVPAMLREAFSVPLPGPFNDLDRVAIADLLDGTLLSFNYGRHMVDGESGSTQTVMLVDAAGAAQVVGRRALAHEFPLLFEHKDWWISPALHALLAVPNLLLDKGIVLDRGLQRYSNQLQRPRPMPVVLAAALMAMLSAGAAAAWLHGARISRRRQAGWTAACLLLGVPALLSLMLLQPRTARIASPHLISKPQEFACS